MIRSLGGLQTVEIAGICCAACRQSLAMWLARLTFLRSGSWLPVVAAQMLRVWRHTKLISSLSAERTDCTDVVSLVVW